MTLPSDSKINFDEESDKILKKFYNSQNDMAFEYMLNSGFNDVGVGSQSWFIFNKN